MEDKIKKFENMLAESQRIVIFSGAGMSTESGIPDFRSSDGLFMQEISQQFSAEEVISHSFFETYPQAFFEFYRDYLVYPDAEPNLGHQFAVSLEDQGKDVSVVTQNIDGLHQKAGSSKVYELHGSTLRNYCVSCGKYYANDDLDLDDKGIPRCSIDGSIVRPDVVLYQEQLDQDTVQASIEAIRQADMLIVCGTSLIVYPAAGFLSYYEGNKLVLVNKTAVQAVRPVDLEFQASINDVFSKVQV